MTTKESSVERDSVRNQCVNGLQKELTQHETLILTWHSHLTSCSLLSGNKSISLTRLKDTVVKTSCVSFSFALCLNILSLPVFPSAPPKTSQDFPCTPGMRDEKIQYKFHSFLVVFFPYFCLPLVWNPWRVFFFIHCYWTTDIDIR